ncbi:MAG: hypothetical protein AB4041_11995 [Microcystaceae cyanobacterium]
MRLFTILTLIIVLTFLNLGDTLLPSSVGRFSKKTRDFLNKLTLEMTLPEKTSPSPTSEEIPAESKKSLTDEYFDRALEEAEKQANAVEDPDKEE